MYSFEQLLELIISKLTFPVNLLIVGIPLLSGLYKVNKKEIDQLIDRLIHFHQKEITILTIIILFLMTISSAIWFVHEELIPKPILLFKSVKFQK